MQYLLMAYVDEAGWPKMSKSEQEQGIAAYAVQGAAAALHAMPDHAHDSRLTAYQPYWAARAELLAKTGARDKAGRAYEMAIGLERDPAVRRFLEKRRSLLG